MRDQRLNFIINVAYFAAIGLLCFFAVTYLLPWFWPFLLGLGMASMFQQISRALRVRGKFAIVAIGFLFYAVVVLLFWLLAAVLIGRIVDLAEWFPGFYRNSLNPAADLLGDQIVAFLHTLTPSLAMTVNDLFDMVASAVSDLVPTVSGALLSLVTGMFKRLPLFLIGFVFMIVSSFAIAMDYNRIVNFLLRQMPPRIRPFMVDIKGFLLSCLLKLLRAYSIILCVTFIELSVGLSALRVDGAVHIALIIAMLDILPLLGSGGFLAPWAIFCLLTGRPALGVGLLVLYGIVLTVRSILEPRVVGDQLGLHPVVTLAAMFFGLRVFGFAGMLAAPVTVLLLVYLNGTGKFKIYRAEG